VKAWESKNAKNAARAGGVSLMALSLAACGGSDDVAVDITPFAQADIDSAVAAANAAAAATAVTVADAAATAQAEAVAGALTAANGTTYATVDAAYTAGSNTNNADAVAAALTDGSGTAHANVDAAITSNDAAITAAATAAAEAGLLSDAGSGFASVADLVAAYITATSPEGAATASYTTSTDLLTSLTTSDDTITGVFGSVADADVLVDVNSTDNDTANLTVADGSNLTVTGIENVTIDVRDTNATSTVVFDKISGADNITLKSSYGSTSMTATKVTSANQKITFDDTDFTTIGVNAGGTADSANNDAHIVLNGAMTATLTTQAANYDIDGLTIETAGGKSTITLTQADDFIAATTGTLDDEYITGTGTHDLTLVVNQAAANGLDGAIVNNEMSGDASLIVKVDGGTLDNEQIDLSKISADKIVIADASSGTSGDLKVGDGAVLETGVADILAHTTAITSATAGGEVTYNVKHADATDVTVTYNSFDTVNIVMAGTAAISSTDDIRTAYTGIGNSTDLNIVTGAAGLTMGTIAAAASSTLDAVTVTGGGDLTVETVAANSMSVNAEDFAAGDLLIEGVIDISASKTVTLDQVDNTSANTATLTVNAGGNISAADAIGKGAVAADLGDVTLISTGGTVTVNEIDSDGAIVITSGASKTVDVGANIAAVGTVTITSGLDIDMDSTVAGSTITLNASSKTVDSTFDGAITGNVIFNGDGVTYASVTNDEDITGNVTVQGGASLSMTAGSEILTGNVTHTGSGTVSIQDLAGQYSGASATGKVDIDDTATGATVIATGSGDDNIITGDVASQINTGAGNDVVNADAVGAAKQVIINTGDGVDTITGGAGVNDQLTGGAGTDTFIISEVADGGSITGMDDILDFKGASGDVLTLSTGAEFTTDGATVKKVDTTDASTTATDATDVLLLTGAGYADEAAVITALTGTSGITAATADDIKDSSIMAVWYNTTAGKVQVAQINETTGTADDVVDGAVTFVTLDGLGLSDIADLVADNFGAIA